MTFDTNSILSKLEFNELAALVRDGAALMRQRQAEGVRRLAEEFEKTSRQQVGLSVRDVVAALGKKRGRKKKSETVAAEEVEI